ncbi:MAG: hypothetical protein F6K54_34540 [Okeania sp. SIO3B5]|uniref:hypothetical protein n=1 Tax=Okeania sp. SIO3B5 TaxID=2607811 RepID=UPI001401B996|nr:hypothetical protein [Okeania sp. SIO3B5]NEO57736.1 hypothetical protein [Okeania sp. SIO3B5]
MTFPLETTLPPELQDCSGSITARRSITQLSQLIAWIWSDDDYYLVFGKDGNEKIAQEKQLKKFLIEIFTNQSIYSGAFISYGNEDAKVRADKLSTCIDFLFKSQNDQIKKEDIIPVEMEIPTLTLEDLFMKMNGNHFVLSLPDGQKFVNECYFIVVTNTFVGSCQIINDSNNPKKFISYLAFPPCYPVNDQTKQDFKNWASENIQMSGSYLPPILLPLGSSS